jgi:hypothetical protein
LPDLPGVTLVAVTSVALTPTLDALKASMRQAVFGEVLLLSDRPPEGSAEGIHWRQIERLNSRTDYSRFMLHELWRHVDTSHVLCIQWDGFVTDGSGWSPNFLDYDYIGAVWPHFGDGHNVGNGGFSLRSRRLLEECRGIPFDGSQLEDVLICRTYRDQLEHKGIRFAPEEVARCFSFERARPTGREFGFHGSFNLVRRVSPGRALRIFRSLEPGMLARGERLELLRWAVIAGRPRFALEMLKRLI